MIEDRPEPSQTDEPESVHITPLRDGADARAFRDLNVEWITAHFTLEHADLTLLNDLRREVIDPGEQVYLARSGGRTVGGVALIAHGLGTFKIAKMAVTPACRGRGIGLS